MDCKLFSRKLIPGKYLWHLKRLATSDSVRPQVQKSCELIKSFGRVQKLVETRSRPVPVKHLRKNLFIKYVFMPYQLVSFCTVFSLVYEETRVDEVVSSNPNIKY